MCCGENYDDGYLDDVEKSGDSAVVVFKWGFKKTRINEKNYLEPLAKEEFISLYAQLNDKTEGQVSHELENGLLDVCGITSYGFCIKPKDCKACQLQVSSAGNYCTCIQY